MRLMITIGVLTCCSCLEELEVGSGPMGDSTEFLIEVPRPPRLDSACPGLATLKPTSVDMLIGGHEQCTLDIDPTTLEVSGTCENITIGIIRPLMLTYRLPPTDSHPLIHWAFRVGWVDLTLEAVQAGSNDAVMLSPDEGSYGYLLLTNEDVGALPADNSMDNQENAGAWARDKITEEMWTLDYDTDGCPNIDEACAGTLYDELIQDC